jgi:hypothetical protein
MCEVELQYLQLLNLNMAIQTTFKEVLEFEVRTCKINLWCISSLVDFIDVESNLQLVMVALVMNAPNATFNFNWNCKDYKTVSLDMLQGIKCSTNFKNKINWDWIEIDWISLGKCTFSPSIGIWCFQNLDQYTNRITPSLQFQFFHNEWLDGYIPPKEFGWTNGKMKFVTKPFLET